MGINRRSYLSFIAVVFLVPAVLCCSPLPGKEGKAVPAAADGAGSITTDNYANTTLEYYYYIPESVSKQKESPHSVLVCVPGLSGSGRGFVPAAFKELARERGQVIVAPSFKFDEANWAAQTSYQYPAAWSGDALLRILDDVRAKNGLKLSRLDLYGFSAGAQYVLRFALWKPEMVRACSAHASGGLITPDRRSDVRFMVSVCRNDTERIPLAERFYSEAGKLGMDVEYKQYDGGHELPPSQIADTVEFFRSIE